MLRVQRTLRSITEMKETFARTANAELDRNHLVSEFRVELMRSVCRRSAAYEALASR